MLLFPGLIEFSAGSGAFCFTGLLAGPVAEVIASIGGLATRFRRDFGPVCARAFSSKAGITWKQVPHFIDHVQALRPEVANEGGTLFRALNIKPAAHLCGDLQCFRHFKVV